MSFSNVPLSRRQLFPIPFAIVMNAVLRPSAEALEAWPTNDWAELEPGQAGMDGAGLRLADQQIRAAMPDVTGFVVVRQNALVFERYYGGRFGRRNPIKIRSVTKSVVSSLIGMAIDDGLLTLDSAIGELIPDRIPDTADPRTADITLRHLLTMTSGWAWDVGTDYETLIAADDWIALTLGLPVVHEPGTFYAYNTGGSHLLSVILAGVTGQDTPDFAQQRLFDPLGIAKPRWQRSPQRETIGGFGLELTPRDMAKLGLLYLREGVWDGGRLLPRAYVEAATTYQSEGDSTGYANYGFQWWVIDFPGYQAYFALGHGSQYVYVVPALDLVVVVVKGFEEEPPVTTFSRPLIETYIVPAVTG